MGRRTFCSDPCVHEWKIRTNPGYVRKLVFDRDAGICAVCRLDTDALKKEIKRTCHIIIYSRAGHDGARTDLAELRAQYPWAVAKGCEYSGYVLSLWQADHIIPVVEGGGECGLENYRTLCTPCHKLETKQLAKRRAESRRQYQEAREKLVAEIMAIETATSRTQEDLWQEGEDSGKPCDEAKRIHSLVRMLHSLNKIHEKDL